MPPRATAREFPGALSMGFVRHVARAEMDSFVQQRRRELGPDFPLRQPGSQPRGALVIDYFEPVTANRKTGDRFRPRLRTGTARGGDAFDVDRGAGLVSATDASADDVGTGLALLLPIYRSGLPVGTAQGRARPSSAGP